MPNLARSPTIVISGSFRKHFDEIMVLIQMFESIGITVLSPKKSKVIDSRTEFVLLDTDDVDNPKILQQRHLDAIRQADALYICNPHGYTGASTILEMGWALALGKPIYAQEEIQDFTLKLFGTTIAKPDNVKHELARVSNTV